jgi:uncharacterized protein YegL
MEAGMTENQVRGYSATEPTREYATVEPGQMIMPFYLLCDVSLSMRNDMQALNEGIQRLRRAIVSEPAVDDVAHIGILTFSDVGKVVLPLSQMSEHGVSALTVEGGTNYGAAFRALAQTITQDNTSLKAQGYKVYRPCAFFLSDGAPGDPDWEDTFRATLTYDPTSDVGMKGHPVFVPYGFRDAPEHVLRKLAYPMGRAKWYHSKSAVIEDALKGILDNIMNTVITSGNSASLRQPAVVQQAPAADSGIAWGDPDPWV